jgi:hypothetical protein
MVKRFQGQRLQTVKGYVKIINNKCSGGGMCQFKSSVVAFNTWD